MAKHTQAAHTAFRAHHRKPYRIRHLTALLIALAAALATTLQLGITIGHNQQVVAPVSVITPAINPAPSLTVVRSNYGYSLAIDTNSFVVTATERTANGAARAITAEQLSQHPQLVAVTIRAKPGTVSGRQAATQLSMEINPDAAALTAAQQKPENKDYSAARTAATLFPVTATGGLQTSIISSNPDTLQGVSVQKTIYQFSASGNSGKSYAIVWSGVSHGRAFALKLNGLTAYATIPDTFATIIAGLEISADQAVLGATTSIFASPNTVPRAQLDSRYLSDALSPAVVQIFHTVCGILTVSGQRLGDSACISFSGSGFLVTQTGYIATNGHVVIYSAKDALADLVVSDESILKAYLTSLGLDAGQIDSLKSDPAALAALISKIYDLPDDQLNFSDKGDSLLVALGSEQPDTQKLVSLASSTELAGLKYDTKTIKPARLIGYDYSAKDSYTAIADPSKGYSASDVALLKIDVSQAPTIPLEQDPVVQNQPIILMGFPGDADNPLIDTKQSAVTVTDGVVSSIRQAAGGKSKLYQSDADASHGNSGGPAIDAQGKAIGLLTYRYADGQDGNAAKSYIRAIIDFQDLATNKAVTIDSSSTTQQLWISGLQLYSRNHFSAALKDFEKVQAAYPAHRLVASYIESSNQAIDSGKDVRDPSINLLAGILLVALLAIGVAIMVIVRHHTRHHLYKTSLTAA